MRTACQRGSLHLVGRDGDLDIRVVGSLYERIPDAESAMVRVGIDALIVEAVECGESSTSLRRRWRSPVQPKTFFLLQSPNRGL